MSGYTNEKIRQIEALLENDAPSRAKVTRVFAIAGQGVGQPRLYVVTLAIGPPHPHQQDIDGRVQAGLRDCGRGARLAIQPIRWAFVARGRAVFRAGGDDSQHWPTLPRAGGQMGAGPALGPGASGL